MNTEVAQLIALVTHCNAALSGLQTPAFSLTHSTAQACSHIRFSRIVTHAFAGPDTIPSEIEEANTPLEWALQLVAMKRRGLRLGYEKNRIPQIPDHTLAAVVPGTGSWVVEVLTRAGVSEFWVARWQVADRAHLDGRIWDVNYVCLGHDSPSDEPNAANVFDDLRAVLTDLVPFARQNGAESFVEAFETALAHLDGAIGIPVDYPDLAPRGLLNSAGQRLLNAAQSAWVFGGIGSWNDLLFRDQETTARYEELSERLWDAVTTAVIECANATFPAAQGQNEPQYPWPEERAA